MWEAAQKSSINHCSRDPLEYHRTGGQADNYLKLILYHIVKPLSFEAYSEDKNTQNVCHSRTVRRSRTKTANRFAHLCEK